MGEVDFSNIMAQFKGPMDENYVRIYWLQMLQAVGAIHERKSILFVFIENAEEEIFKIIFFFVCVRVCV